jgi:hypothetical protein
MPEGAASEDRLTFLTPLLFKRGCCEGKLRMKIALESPLETGLCNDTV